MVPAVSATGQAIVVEVSKSDAGEMADFMPTGLALEYQTRSFANLGAVAFSFGFRISADDGESTWLGAGVVAEAPLGGAWILEGAFMPGVYDSGSEDFDLGSDIEFLTSIGIGYALGEQNRLSLAAWHLSNGGTADRNPGRNALALRFLHGF